MRFEYNGTILVFRPHNPDQGRPYQGKRPLVARATIDGKTKEVLMNSELTPHGNVSSRISFEAKDDHWYYRDDARRRSELLGLIES